MLYVPIDPEIVLCSDPTNSGNTFRLGYAVSQARLASLKAEVRQHQKASSVVKGLNLCGLQYVNFPSLRATLVVAIL